MSIKIKVSYEQNHELQRILKQLMPLGITYRVAKRQDGRFKRAYINVKE